MIRIGIIGCGYWGKNYIRIFEELPGAKVTALCDANSQRLKKMEETYPTIKGVVQFEKLFPLVDAVVIATQASTHYPIALACLEAGKHILVEKPLTTSWKDAYDLIQQERGLVLMTGFTFLYNRGIRKAKELLQNMNSIYYLHATRTNMGPIREDVNVVWDLATHDISIFNYLLESNPYQVSAVGGDILDNGLVDTAFLSLEYPRNILGHIHVSWLNPNKVREVVIVGDERRIVFNDMSISERIKIFEKGVAQKESNSTGPYEHQFLMRDGDILIPKLDLGEPLKEQARTFLNCIQGGLVPLSDGKMGLDVVNTIEAINLSINLGGSPVRID